jgi:hypothetical protein
VHSWHSTVFTAMFCTRCGKENRDDASFCTLCGTGLVQTSAAAVPERPSTGGKAWWIAGAVVAIIVAVTIVVSMTVHAWVLNQSDQSGHVVVDGKTLVGADGEPIELSRNSEAKDVDWDQLKQFLSSDQTDSIRYKDSTFVCGDFAETLFNNAEKAGIRAGYVVIDFEPGTPGHACNVFRTTDRGMVYIDDTGTTMGTVNADKTVDIAVGKSYCPVSVFSSTFHEVTWECLGTVSHFDVIW